MEVTWSSSPSLRSSPLTVVAGAAAGGPLGPVLTLVVTGAVSVVTGTGVSLVATFHCRPLSLMSGSSASASGTASGRALICGVALSTAGSVTPVSRVGSAVACSGKSSVCGVDFVAGGDHVPAPSSGCYYGSVPMVFNSVLPVASR